METPKIFVRRAAPLLAALLAVVAVPCCSSVSESPAPANAPRAALGAEAPPAREGSAGPAAEAETPRGPAPEREEAGSRHAPAPAQPPGEAASRQPPPGRLAAPEPPVPAVTTTPEGITVDRDRGEIRFPCLFVNPTRLLEVFACHREGPTHETVVQFDVTGPALYKALLSLGLHDASHYNGTSPSDFEKNQGDRLLVLVRWSHKGVTREYPAEAMLLDGPSRFPAFIRGFSFSTRRVALPPEKEKEDAPADGAPEEAGAEAPAATHAPAVPRVVEISLGATNRQSPSYSLLSHPTNLPRVLPWMVPPELDTRAVPDHRELVEEKVPAVLILRRIDSEEKLVEYARSMARERGLKGRGPLYDRLLPVAREIDRLKGEYRDLLGNIGALLEKKQNPALLDEKQKTAQADLGMRYFRRGRWLCARIEERYLTQYTIQEELKAKWASEHKDLPVEVREEIGVLVQNGMRFEPLLAAKRVAVAALDLPGSDLLPAERRLRKELLNTQARILELQRQRELSDASLRHVRRRLRSLPADDTYLRRLLGEDESRLDAQVRSLKAEKVVAQTEAEELQGMLDGHWEAIRKEVLARRAAARNQVKQAALQKELVEVEGQIRWAENDAKSGISQREAGAREELQKLTAKKKDLEAQLQQLLQ